MHKYKSLLRQGFINAIGKLTGRITLNNKCTYSIFSKVSFEASVGVDQLSEIHLSSNVIIGPGSVLTSNHGSRLSIGVGSTFHSYCILSGDITIGANCLFSPRVTILSSTHQFRSKKLIRMQDSIYMNEHGSPQSLPITIGDDCWIGINAVIMPGVSLGNGCVVGANSVVTKSFSEYCIVAGVPAKVIGYRE